MELDLDLDLDSEHNDDDLESDSRLSDSVDRAGSAEEFQWSLTLPEQVLSLTILVYNTPRHQLSYSKLFITDDFETKMAEQTKCHAVQRGAPRSLKQVSDGVINLYLCNFGSNLGVAFVEGPSNLWVKRP